MSDDDKEIVKDIISSGARKAAGELIVTALNPAAEEVGKGLATVAKTVNICLTPLSITVWGYDKIRSYVEEAVTEKLADVSPEKIAPPALNIAGPTIEALRFASEEDHLKKMFTSLLATAMNSDKKIYAHPAYIELIKQISADEAKILNYIFVNGLYPDVVDASYEITNNYHDKGIYLIKDKFKEFCQHLEIANSNQIGSYFDNLQRLKVIEMNQGLNSRALNASYLDDPKYAIKQENKITVTITDFGEQFLFACV